MVHGKFTRQSSVQDVTWFIDLKENNRLDLKPPYQRRSVWTRKDRIYFLDTIFKGYPCPTIYLHKTIDDKGKATYHVIDGKQRLEAILDFINDSITLPIDFDNSNPELAGKKFKNINIDYKKLFWNYSIPVDQFDAVEVSIIDEMFDRLNRNSRKLEAQELRHAKYDGWFVNYAEKMSENSLQLKEIKVVTSGRSKRMKDVQFISELMMVLIKKDIQGFSQYTIDDIYAEYDNPEEELDYDTNNFDEEFNRIITYIYDMNKINNCVIDYATTVGQFYTLFALIALAKDEEKEKLANINTIAEKYKMFMEIYKNHVINNDSTDMRIIHYAKASTGASTEEPLRRTRLVNLNQYIFEE